MMCSSNCPPPLYKISHTKSSNASTQYNSRLKQQLASFLLMITFFAAGSILSPLHMWNDFNYKTKNKIPGVLQYQDKSVRSVAIRTRQNSTNIASEGREESTRENEIHDDDGQHQTVAETVFIPPQTNFSGILARKFKPWKRSLPCFKPEQEWRANPSAPANSGFLYVKPYKTGSSTTSGINLRIARNVALRLGKSFPICRGESAHREPFSFGQRR